MAFNPLSLLILKFRGRSVAVIRDLCTRYENILSLALRNFETLQRVSLPDIIILASIPGYPDPSQVEISPKIWLMIYNIVHSVTIALKSEMQPANECSRSSPDLPDYEGEDEDEELTFVTVASPVPAPNIPPSTRPSSSQPPRRLIPGQPRQAPRTPTFFPPNEDVHFRPRKPVIYLFPPFVLLNVTVELLLTSTWRFSVVYPPPQSSIPSDECETLQSQSLTWAIAAEPSGTLIDKTTGTEVSYLFWEAIANVNFMTPNTSRAATPVGDLEAFDPSCPSVSPADSILLPIGKVPGYLDTALKALTLHTEARTSFITYWLPDLLKHEYIALHFVAQASYEQAAKMRVSPAPDVVTRVFMLFRGVASGDLDLWSQATARATAEDGATFWTNVVGIDSARASDGSLFRVLEWGGMEVK